jgi:tetratricopeptide (TPR) repeat protein
MKKNLYIVLLCFSGLLLLAIFLFAKKPEKIPPFKERTGKIAMSAEWLNTRQAIHGLLAAIKQNPGDTKSMLALTQAYIQEARITGDHAYYDKASLDLLKEVLDKDPKNFEALCCKATVLLSQHHFSEGLEVAKIALPINPSNAYIYGAMCDAYVELGNYDEAVKMADKMVSVRPDIRSYSRVSYLREIYGDLPGAISAMKLAVSAGFPGLEQSEWARMILGHLYESCGKLDSAQAQYELALLERREYPFAFAGMGRIAKAKKNYPDAIKFYEIANSMITEYSFSDELTDLYRLNKETEKAKQSAEKVIQMLGPGSGDEGQSGHGHYADKELAYAYLKLNDTDNALKHALLEYERRPENIDVCETVAWVRYKRGEFAAAGKLIDTALRTHSKNPVLLCRAGMIKIKNGNGEEGKILIKNSLELNPYLDIDLQTEALRIMNSN